MGWVDSNVHSEYNLTEDNDGKGVIVHNTPTFYLKGNIKRLDANTINYQIDSISNYTSGSFFGFYYKLSLKIGEQYIEIVSLNQGELNGVVTKNINKSGSVAVQSGAISVSIQIKCQATVEGKGCTILGKNDDAFSGYTWDNVPYFPILTFDTEFVDPYLPPSNLSFSIKNVTTKSLTVVPNWTNGTVSNTLATIKCYSASAGVEEFLTTSTPNSDVTFNNLKHDTTYTIDVSVSDYITAITGTTQTATTQKITITFSSHPSQYYIYIIFHPRIDGTLNVSKLKFHSIKCLLGSTKVGTYVSLNDVNTQYEIRDLNYYTTYKIKYYVTDGYNVVGVTVTDKTLLPCIRLYYNGNWVRAVPYIYSNNKWNLSVGMVYCKDENNVLKWHDTYYP